MLKVSVIIPCYNLGHYLDEAVASVLAQTFQDFEIIILNDGSTDEATNALLRDYQRPRTRVIHTQNQGLASARNAAISAAVGEYILPLDADDLIEKTYLEKAVAILEEKSDIGVVSCQLEFFEAVKFKPELPPLSIERMLVCNEMSYSSVYRREFWERCGGYNANMRYGWEDWDFWLSMHELGAVTYRIPEVLFYYRIRESSMLRSMTREKQIAMYVQMFHNHENLFSKHIDVIFAEIYEFIQLKNSKEYRYMKYFTNPKSLLHKITRKTVTSSKQTAA